MGRRINDDQHYRSMIKDNDMNYVDKIINKSDDLIIVVSICFLKKDQLYKMMQAKRQLIYNISASTIIRICFTIPNSLFLKKLILIET